MHIHKYWLRWHLKKVFHFYNDHKLIKTQNFLQFPDRKCPFTQNFAKQPNIFLVPKVLRIIFSRKSNSRIANVCLSVCTSVCHRNPKASQNCSYWPLSLLTIKPFDHRAYPPSSLLTIKPFNHQAQAYRPSSLLTIEPIDHQAYRPLVFFRNF